MENISLPLPGLEPQSSILTIRSLYSPGSCLNWCVFCIFVQLLVIYHSYFFQTPFFWLSNNWEPENVDYGRLTI